MRNSIILVLFIAMVSLVSCDEKSGTFKVTGTINNTTAKMVYLDQVPAATMQPFVVDSAVIGKDGKFSLQAGPKESEIYNLRLDENEYPVATVISDVPAVDLSIKMSAENKDFAESYDVKNSPATQKLTDFVTGFTKHLQGLFPVVIREDSLAKKAVPGQEDSLLVAVSAEKKVLTDKLYDFSRKALENAGDPALLVFELGYYQYTANNTSYGVPAFTDEYVLSVIEKVSKEHPKHESISAVKDLVSDRIKKREATSFIGKDAPEFTLPDPNGANVALSSFRGKYVLVDFWASWCGPCRRENPNVVNAYNKYKSKNFTILGVSLDRKKDAWVNAIMQDKLTWPHVSDLQYWQSAVVPLYRIEGIPFNVLIDPQGKIIAQNLTGLALEAKLGEVLN